MAVRFGRGSKVTIGDTGSGSGSGSGSGKCNGTEGTVAIV